MIYNPEHDLRKIVPSNFTGPDGPFDLFGTDLL